MRRAVLFSLIPVGFVVFIAVLEIPLAIWAFARNGDPLFTAIILALVLGISIWWTRESWGEMFETIVEARDWAKGAAGERAAADDLRQLPPEYLVLNDVHPGFRGVSQRWNWDHVIIGPTGLFVVDSKNYSAKRIRDGESDARTRRNVKQVRGYAIEFKKELTRLNPNLRHEFIVPVLAYVNEDTWVESLREKDVRVLPLRLLRTNVLGYSTSSLPTAEAVRIANLLFGMYAPHIREAYDRDFVAWARARRDAPWPQGTTHGRREPSTSADTAVLACPVCGAQMVRRSGQFGAFWVALSALDRGVVLADDPTVKQAVKFVPCMP